MIQTVLTQDFIELRTPQVCVIMDNNDIEPPITMETLLFLYVNSMRVGQISPNWLSHCIWYTVLLKQFALLIAFLCPRPCLTISTHQYLPMLWKSLEIDCPIYCRHCYQLSRYLEWSDSPLLWVEARGVWWDSCGGSKAIIPWYLCYFDRNIFRLILEVWIGALSCMKIGLVRRFRVIYRPVLRDKIGLNNHCVELKAARRRIETWALHTKNRALNHDASVLNFVFLNLFSGWIMTLFHVWLGVQMINLGHLPEPRLTEHSADHLTMTQSSHM